MTKINHGHIVMILCMLRMSVLPHWGLNAYLVLAKSRECGKMHATFWRIRPKALANGQRNVAAALLQRAARLLQDCLHVSARS